MTGQGYHHQDLRRTLLAATATAIAETGPTALSLRELARRAGVSHAAPAHHFGDKAGLLAAFAAQGYDLLATALQQAGGDFLDVGVAYVRFAVEHRAHFEVMFQPSLYRVDDPQVTAARARAGDALGAGLRALPAGRTPRDATAARLAAWSIVHGFATLWLNGAFPPSPELVGDPQDAARSVIRLLFEH